MFLLYYRYFLNQKDNQKKGKTEMYWLNCSHTRVGVQVSNNIWQKNKNCKHPTTDIRNLPTVLE